MNETVSRCLSAAATVAILTQFAVEARSRGYRTPMAFVGQATSDDSRSRVEKELFNPVGGPIQLGAMSNGRGYFVANATPRAIASYRLGCVRTDGKRIRVVSKAGTLGGPLSPATSDDIQQAVFYGANHGYLPNRCNDGLIAVVEVTFECGEIWSLSEHLSTRQPN